MSSVDEKVYLGDGVYAYFDGYGIMLTSENGLAVTNKIYLEQDVLKALTDFNKKVRG
jgi:hypothetical protein